jgi:hypothetical protein
MCCAQGDSKLAKRAVWTPPNKRFELMVASLLRTACDSLFPSLVGRSSSASLN